MRVSVRIAITQSAGVVLSLIIRGITIVYHAIQKMRQRTILVANVLPAIQRSAGVVHSSLTMGWPIAFHVTRMMHHRGTIQVNVPIAIMPRLDGEVIPLTIQDSQIVVPVTPAMHLQTTITGSAHNVTPPVVGREEDLTILVKLIAFHATLEMRLPDIIQVNVRIAIHQTSIGEMQSFPT
jgi:hypothetical protein